MPDWIIKRENWPWFYLGFLALAAVVPIGNTPELIRNYYHLELKADYLIHASLFLPLPIIVLAGWKDVMKQKSISWMLIPFLIFSGAIIESLQLLTPYRSFNVNDLWSNVAGVLIGLVPAAFVWRRSSGSGRPVPSARGGDANASAGDAG